MSDLRQAASFALTTLQGWSNHDHWLWPQSALAQAKQNTTEAISLLEAALAESESASLEQGVQQMQPFVVRHYIEDERPTIKGNGFDGLEIGEDREEAEAFVAWINEKLARWGK